MTNTSKVPQITLNNGVELPALGLGVFQSPPAETTLEKFGREIPEAG